MQDYNKLTVIKLREELVKRGLPKSGLKPVLVSRLREADAQVESQAAPASPTSETSTLQQEKPSEDTRSELPTPVGDIPAVPLPALQDEGIVADASASPAQPQDQEHVESSEWNTDKGPSLPAGSEIVEVLESHHTTEVGALRNDISSTTQEPSDRPHLLHETREDKLPDSLIEPQPTDSTINALTETFASNETVTDSTLPRKVIASEADQMQDSEIKDPSDLGSNAGINDKSREESMQSPVTGQEISEDNKKRKRRSHSPVPSLIETAQKRVRTDDSRPDVKLPEDIDMQDTQSARAERVDDDAVGSPNPIKEDSQTDQDVQPASTDTKQVNVDASISNDSAIAASKSLSSDRAVSGPEDEPQLKTMETQLQPLNDEIAPRVSPEDARFKNLFTAPPKRSASPTRQALYSDHEDRHVSPSVHPATSALYIRNFMRPLQPLSLKEHLVALATPSSASPYPDIITDFFLDPIRTHCLVRFSSISAASRVRSTLHDRVWPDERTRRPLWVDFVPEEKLQKWIEVENEAAVSKRQMAKRWEVVYEEEDGGMKAYLQEASSGPRPNPSNASKMDHGSGISGAPSGPRNRAAENRPSQPISKPNDNGKGFQALDDLFQSTTAKPKLYYLPVRKSIADKRLDRLDEGRGHGRGGDELRKYTFEEDVLVDCGPESPRRVRGNYGGRGGGYGGYGGYGGHGGYHGRGGGGYRGGDRRDRR